MKKKWKIFISLGIAAFFLGWFALGAQEIFEDLPALSAGIMTNQQCADMSDLIVKTKEESSSFTIQNARDLEERAIKFIEDGCMERIKDWAHLAKNDPVKHHIDDNP